MSSNLSPEPVLKNCQKVHTTLRYVTLGGSLPVDLLCPESIHLVAKLKTEETARL